MMRRNCLYRHRNNNTIAFEVIKRFYVAEKRLWKLKVLWWNIGSCHKPWPIVGLTQNIKISDSSLVDWGVMPFNGLCPPPKCEIL